MLAGISVDYYAKLERGVFGDVSPAVWDSIARVLRLSVLERDHLRDLTRPVSQTSPASDAAGPRESVLRIVDWVHDRPAFLRNRRRDQIAANDLGRALYPAMFVASEQPPNAARYIFLNPEARQVFPDWDDEARNLAGALRMEAAKDPSDSMFRELIGELVTKSMEFAQFWAEHDLHTHLSGRKRVDHPQVGRLNFDFETLVIPDDPQLTLTIYGCPEDSPDAEKLRLLASLSASA
jgi:hypothetical protein